jgi:hypothetical protein
MPAREALRLGGPLLEGRSAIVTGSEIDINGGSHIH